MTATTSSAGPSSASDGVDALARHTRSAAVTRRLGEEAARAHQDDEDHEAVDDRRQVLARGGRQQVAGERVREADREAAERRRDEPVQAADHHPDEREDRHGDAVVGSHERRGHGEQHRDRRREHAGDREGGHDHAVGAHAERARGAQVGGGGAQLQPDHRAVEQQRERAEQDDRGDRGDDRDPADPQRAERDRGVQAAERPDGAAARAEREQIDVLEQEADGEGGDQHRRRRSAAQRPEGDPLLQQRERDDDGEADDDRDEPGRAGEQRERVAAGGDQLAVGEVDEPHHAEDEPDPDADDGVDGAEPDAVDQGLEEGHRVRKGRPR